MKYWIKNRIVDFITIIGLVASIITAGAMLPQLIKVIKEKDAENISLVMPIIYIVGLGLWVYYGFLKKDWIIIGANVFSVVLNILMMFFSVKYKK